MIDSSYVLAGSCTSFVFGLTGVGGGALMTPIILLFFLVLLQQPPFQQIYGLLPSTGQPA
jgi:uncharacterized membrane protein YfcA